ncbi:MAG TPA: hypothetical protein VMU84_07805 [Thermoanaerobaculia bacterium]|nr:hypothetical protein [Thermoanaerobaculia bacterium]
MISVADRQRRRGVVFRLTEPLRERIAPVTVLWPDGKPVAEANVWLSEVAKPTWVVGGSVSHTNAEGVFDLVGFEGIDYFVRANIYVRPGYKPHCAEKKTITASDVIAERIVMVLTKTGDVCTSMQFD